MIILTLRTDKPEAEIGIFNDQTQLSYEVWTAHRKLAETIHTKIREELAKNKKEFDDLQGIVAYQGPGSFTGLRIGLTVANTLAYGLNISIIGASGDDWREKGIRRLSAKENDKAVMPEYGADVHITKPKT